MHVAILKTLELRISYAYFDYYIKILRCVCTNFYQAATLSEMALKN